MLFKNLSVNKEIEYLLRSKNETDIKQLAKIINPEYFLKQPYYNDAVDELLSLFVRLNKYGYLKLFLENNRSDFLDWVFVEVLDKLRISHILETILPIIPTAIIQKYKLN